MNQYERIVSYIYQYRQDEKGANVGYVRLEKRGNSCRLFVQMRVVPMSSMPKVYLYRQLEQGISKVYAGQMAVRGGSMLFKADSSAEKLFGSEQGIEEMDGIFIDTEEELYFASSWKNDSFYLGAKKDEKISSEPEQKAAEQKGEQKEEQEEEQAENLQEASMEDETEQQNAAVQQKDVIQENAFFERREEENESKVIPETVNSEKVETRQQVAQRVQQHNVSMKDTINDAMMERADRSETRDDRRDNQRDRLETQSSQRNRSEARDNQRDRSETQSSQRNRSEARDNQRDRSETQGRQKGRLEETDIQMQSICGVCPFKRNTYDYGKKILMTFPSMKPFQAGVARACVRMELQDIGCLPIASWSLSGNRFLLHGYYCYRHLLFAQMEDGRYVLGVPGIYSDRERKNALRFGFSDFQSIGDFGMQQGAFGYWLLELPEENQRFSFK